MRPALQKSGQVWVRTPGTSKRGIPREIAEIAKVMSGVLDSETWQAIFRTLNLKHFIQRDTWLASAAPRLTRAQRLEELWVFLQVPPHSVARGPRVDRLVLVRRKAIRIQLAAVGWEN